MVYIDYDPNDNDTFVEFCGDLDVHEPHDDGGTAAGGYFLTTCYGVPDEERKTIKDCE